MAERVAMYRGTVFEGRASVATYYAACDPEAHHVEPGVRPSKFGALLSPFPTGKAAQDALFADGANEVVEVLQ